MSILFFDGFDYTGSVINAPGGLLNLYGWDGDSDFAGTFVGRYGGYCIGGLDGSITVGNNSTLIVNWGFIAPTGGESNTTSFVEFMDSSISNAVPTVQCGLGLNSGYQFFFTRGRTTILGTSVYTLQPGRWHWISFKATFSGTTGTLSVAVDGTVFYSLTGINNIITANSSANVVRFRRLTAQTAIYDDVIINDTLGVDYNDHLTDKKISNSAPNAAGDSTTWSTTEINNYTGASIYLDANYFTQWDKYNYSSVIGNVDLYNHENNYSTKSSTVYDYVKFITKCSKMTQGPRKIKPLFKTGATVYELTEVEVPSGWSAITETISVNPNTTQKFTGTELNAIQTGIKITV